MAPGESRAFERRVDASALRSGKHEIEVEYYAPKLLPGFETNLKTNAVPFTIER